MFYHSENTFNSILISMASRVKSEPNSLQCSRELFRVDDEKRRVDNIVFLAKFLQTAQSMPWLSTNTAVGEGIGLSLDRRQRTANTAVC